MPNVFKQYCRVTKRDYSRNEIGRNFTSKRGGSGVRRSRNRHYVDSPQISAPQIPATQITASEVESSSVEPINIGCEDDETFDPASIDVVKRYLSGPLDERGKKALKLFNEIVAIVKADSISKLQVTK